MSSRSPRRSDVFTRKDRSPRVKRRRFTEFPEKRSPRPLNKNRDSDRVRRISRSPRRERSRSRSPIHGKKDKLDQMRNERKYHETPPRREKRKLDELAEPSRDQRNNNNNGAVHRRRDVSPIARRQETNNGGGAAAMTTKRYDQTEFLLDDRFSALCTNRPLVVEDNVSVEIERKIPGREGFKIPKIFDPAAVSIPVVSHDDHRSLTLREEFKDKSRSSTDLWRPDANFKGRNLEKRVIRPGDVRNRHNVQPRSATGMASEREDRPAIARSRMMVARGERRRDDAIRGRGRNVEDLSGHLPDFSRRPGKYAYEPWKDRPEMIPKGRSYYEHDLRDRLENDDDRSRDFRRGQRPRGGGGGGRGRGDYNRQVSRPDADVWTHDKYEEMEKEESVTGLAT